MPLENDPAIVDFDAAAALAAVRETVDGTLYSFVEYDDDGFNHLYVADETLAFYPDEAEMFDHFERIHGYVHVDFMEMELFTDTIVPIADSVEHIVTATDALTILRIYVGDQGLFVALDPDEPVSPVLDAIGRAIER